MPDKSFEKDVPCAPIYNHQNKSLFIKKRRFKVKTRTLPSIKGKKVILLGLIKVWMNMQLRSYEDITWPLGDTKFFFECRKIFHE